MKPFSKDGSFQPISDGGGLRRVAVRGAGVTMLSQSMGLIIQMTGTVTLARLLTPTDFGLLTMVTTFSLFLVSLGVNGFFEAVIQRPLINHALATNLFWINASIGLIVTVVFAASGPLLARFYGNPLLPRITVAMSATIFFSCLSGIHLALLKRAMRFTVTSSNDFVARALSIVVSVLLAWAGWGYWALVAGAVVLQGSTSIGALIMCRWIPGLPRRGVGTLAMIRFAMNTYGHFAANYCTKNIDNFLVGWSFGPQSLGLYKKAYDLCVLPLGQISDPLNAVAVPTLSRLAGDPERYQRYVLRALSALAFVGMGLGAGLFLVGRDLLVVLLGPRWEESGRIFTFFAPGIGALLVYMAYIWIHLSSGRADRLFRWGIIEFAVIVLLFLLGLRFGPRGVALAWVAASWILVIPALWYAGRPAGLAVTPIVRVIWKYVVASVLAGCTAALMVRGIVSVLGDSAPFGAAGRVVIVTIMFGALYLGAVILVHGGCAPLHEAEAILRDMLPDKFSRLFTLVGANSNTSEVRRDVV